MVANCTRCGAQGITDRLQGLCPGCLFRETGAAAPDPVQGGRFGQFEVVATLGRGGMGTVYKVRQSQLDRFAGLKVLSPVLAADPEFRNRFVQEAQVLAKLVHPNIVSIFDFGVHDGFYYLLMEYVDGVNLRQILDTRMLSSEELLKLVPPLCEALEVAHAQGIVHRDIKPENILVDRKGQVKITDFGIAKIANSSRKITQAGVVMGTPAYMAPEQTQSLDAVDHRADLYSLGAIIYEILTGKVPSALFVRPSRIARTDPRMDVVLERALARDPGSRYEKASQIRDQVTEVLASPRPPVRRRPIRWAAGILAFLGLTVGLALVWRLPRREPSRPAVTQEPPGRPVLAGSGADFLLSTMEALEPNILEYSRGDLSADQKIWVVDWKFQEAVPAASNEGVRPFVPSNALTTTLEVVVTRRPSFTQARDALVRCLLNYDEKSGKPVDDRKPCLIVSHGLKAFEGHWRVELDRQDLPWPVPSGYAGLKPDDEAPRTYWRYRITLRIPSTPSPVPERRLTASFRSLERRLPGLVDDASRDQLMSVYRDQIGSLESALKEAKVEIGRLEEGIPGVGRFGFNWELPSLNDFGTLANLQEERRLLREIEKRFWIRRDVVDAVLRSGLKGIRILDFRFFRKLSERFAAAAWEHIPSRPEEIIHWPGLNAAANGMPVGFAEWDLPFEQGKTLTFGFALVLPYSEARGWLRQFLAARADENAEDRLFVDVVGCHLTILDQQDPQVRYRDGNTVKVADLELNSFRKRGEAKEIADPVLRAVVAKAGPTRADVLLAVTCRTLDPAKPNGVRK
jgi:serine/threonine protein kinase